MTCPKCGARGYVYSTERREDGSTWRYYRCPGCYFGWRTVERIEKGRYEHEPDHA